MRFLHPTTLKQRIESLEAHVLRETLTHYHWNKSKAAKKLGLSRVGLNNKIVRYGIEKVRPVQGQEEKDIDQMTNVS